MNNLYAFLICTLTFTTHIFSMHEITKLSPISESFPYAIKKRILFDLAENIHQYVKNEPERKRIRIACSNILNVSLVNKELSELLDKQRNNGPTARTIITNIKETFNELDFDSKNIQQFLSPVYFPGVKKCFEASSKLYALNLNPDMIEPLFKEGAIINFSIIASSDFPGLLKHAPLMYWCCITRKDENQKKTIVKKLLECGANPNNSNILKYTISTAQLDLTKLILQYNPLITDQAWSDALDNKDTTEYLDLLIQQAKQNELNIGLIACSKMWCDHDNNYISYRPNDMQKFINHGASMAVALKTLTQILPNVKDALNLDSPLLQNIIFFCNQGAFDTKALAELRRIEKLYKNIADQLEKNNK